jgi:hypothetical protein
MKILSRVIVVFVLFLTGVAGALAQESKIVGNILDPTGASIEFVKIEVVDKNGKAQSTLTKSNGSYHIDVAPGTFTVVASEGKGFLKTKISNYTVPPKTTMRLDVVLDVDMESPTSIYSEFVCDKSGENCRYESRQGTGTSRPKEIVVSHESATTKNRPNQN